jgi:REP element-mobilizing transposase RayT
MVWSPQRKQGTLHAALRVSFDMATTIKVLAYHITWTTYGTWLPGDKRGWIKKSHHGVRPPDWRIEGQSRERMTEDAIVLSEEQRAIVEQTIATHCVIRKWTLHAANARTNHVHTVITAEVDPDVVMNQLKAWCSRRLSDAAELTESVAVRAGRRRWFTEGGDKKLIHDEVYLRNAIQYVLEGQ